MHSHLLNLIKKLLKINNKAGHSCETVLLIVYNDIVTTICRSNETIFISLDLYATFDTIDLNNLSAYVNKCRNL